VGQVLDYFKDKKEVGFDTETTGFDPYLNDLLLYQLGDRENQFVFDAESIPVTVVKGILEDKDKIILMQNAKFDLRFLYVFGIIPENVYDTYLAEAVLFTGIKTARKALDFLAEKYCGVKLNKSIRKAIHYEGKTQRVIKYAAGDVTWLGLIKEAQEEELKKKDLLTALALDNLFVKVLAYTEYCGIYLNNRLWERKMTKDLEEYEDYKEKLNNWVLEHELIDFIDPQLDLFNANRSCGIKWSSSQQVGALMKSLGVDITTSNDKESVEAKFLKKQSDKTDLIPLYLSFKAAEKKVSTYGDNFLNLINPITGRIHSSFTQILSTGRMSCGGKQGKLETVNLQNIPRDSETRSCFTIQHHDNALVNSDYSSQEPILIANFSQEEKLIKFYKDGNKDMHSYIASLIFPELKDKSLEEIKEEFPEQRYLAKTAGLAMNYGAGGITIAENADTTVEEGEEVYNVYMKAFPDLKEFFKKCHESAFKNGYILFNDVSRRKSFIPYFEDFKSLEAEVKVAGFWDNYRWHKEKQTAQFENRLKPLVKNYFKKRSEIERIAQNYPIQGSAADCTKLAGVYLFQFIMENNLFNILKISNIVHDEYLCECPKTLAERAAKTLKECMERAGDKFCKIVKLEAIPVINEKWEH